MCYHGFFMKMMSNNAFMVIQNVWLYRIYCCTLPLIGSGPFDVLAFCEEWWPEKA